MKTNFHFLPFLVLVLISISLLSSLLHPKDYRKSRLIDAPALALPVLDGEGTFSPAAWKGQVTVLHVFASWCPYCQLQHPLIQELADSTDVPIMGLAWRNSPQDLRPWLAEHGNPFQQIGIDENRQSTVPLGLMGVPDTFIFDKNGKVAYRSQSNMSRRELHETILPLLERLQRE